jgi:hypothetical protein
VYCPAASTPDATQCVTYLSFPSFHPLNTCTVCVWYASTAFAVWNTQLMDHRTGNQVIKRLARVQRSRTQKRTFLKWLDYTVMERKTCQFLIKWRRQYCRGCFDHWLKAVRLTQTQRKTIRRVHGVMTNRQIHTAFTRWTFFATERKWAAQVGGQVLRRLKSQLIARAFSSWVAWIRSMQKAVTQTKAVLMRIFQRALSAAFNAWAAEHRARQRRTKVMAVCVCRLQRFSLSRAFHRWVRFTKEMQRSRRVVEHVVHRLQSLSSARAFSVRSSAIRFDYRAVLFESSF